MGGPHLLSDPLSEFRLSILLPITERSLGLLKMFFEDIYFILSIYECFACLFKCALESEPPKSGPLEEQQVLLTTELLLQHLDLRFPKDRDQVMPC